MDPRRSVGSAEDLRTKGPRFEYPVWSIFFPRIDDSHCDRIRSSLIAVHCFDNGYGVGKQPVAWKNYCAEYWLKKFQESMDRCSGRGDKIEII